MGLYISNQWSSRLMGLISDLSIVGLERSAKFTHRSLNSDRFIIGPQHKSFAADCLKNILTELYFPVQYLSEALQWFGKSNQSGFGFEQNSGVASYRFYLEFFDRYKPDPSLNKGLIHLGYKWQCDDPSKITITHYSFAPSFNGDNPEQVIRNRLVSINKQFVKNVVSAALKSVEDIPPLNRIMTCASEATGCRRSFDLNVYKSQNELSYITPELVEIARFFRVEEQVVEKFIVESGNATLGHIACGLNTLNNPFFTVYFDDYSSSIN